MIKCILSGLGTSHYSIILIFLSIAALTQFDKSSYLNHNSSDYYSLFNLRYSQIII